jgi:hypothetical protein
MVGTRGRGSGGAKDHLHLIAPQLFFAHSQRANAPISLLPCWVQTDPLRPPRVGKCDGSALSPTFDRTGADQLTAQLRPDAVFAGIDPYRADCYIY